jgi:hypothetical protein
MQIVFRNDEGCVRPIGQDHPDITISQREIALLVSQYRLYGFFRLELETGLIYFSKAAHEIYGMAFSEGPANVSELVARTHPDDIELVYQAFEMAASSKATFHVIHRYAAQKGQDKILRVVGRYREGKTPGGELAGVVYEFYERLNMLGLSG